MIKEIGGWWMDALLSGHWTGRLLAAWMILVPIAATLYFIHLLSRI